MLFYKVLLHKIDGKVYNTIKNIYASTMPCVQVNNKQGCNLSPTLFTVFSNDLVKEICDLNLGISVGEIKVSILMYADDIVLLTDSEEKLQSMRDTLHS